MENSLIEFLLAIHWLLELSPVFSISFCNGVVDVQFDLRNYLLKKFNDKRQINILFNIILIIRQNEYG